MKSLMQYINEWKEDPEHESLDDFNNDIVNHYMILLEQEHILLN